MGGVGFLLRIEKGLPCSVGLFFDKCYPSLVTLQSTILVFEGFRNISLGVPLAILSPMRS